MLNYSISAGLDVVIQRTSGLKLINLGRFRGGPDVTARERRGHPDVRNGVTQLLG